MIAIVIAANNVYDEDDDDDDFRVTEDKRRDLLSLLKRCAFRTACWRSIRTFDNRNLTTKTEEFAERAVRCDVK